MGALRRRVATAALVAACASSVAPSGCGDRHAPEAVVDQRPPVVVDVAVTTLHEVPDVYEAVGTVRPLLGATIAAQVTAPVLSVSVRVGSQVAARQELARLDDRELRAQYDQAAADYRRVQALLAKHAATRAELDLAESRYRVTEAALSYATITAPFAATVTEKLCDPGDMATPGKPLFVVEAVGAFRLEVAVPERLIGLVTVGNPVDVTLDAITARCVGTVGEVVPAADPASRSVTVKIDLGCPAAVRSGAFGRARIAVGTRELLGVPRSALHRRGQLAYVFVVEQGRARMRIVKVGHETADLVEILAGLDVGESVVATSGEEMTDGRSVTVPDQR